MNSLIWIAQLVLAGIFLVSGILKILAFSPAVHALQLRAHGAIELTPIQGKFVGLVEVALGFGVLMPDIFKAETLVPEYLVIRFSAAGLAVLMIATGIYHARRKESAALAVSIFLLALFVIVGRWPAF